MRERNITIRVSEEVFERLNRLRREHTWKEFLLMCIIRNCREVIDLAPHKADVLNKDIRYFQREAFR